MLPKRRRILCCIGDQGETCLRLTDLLKRAGREDHDIIATQEIRSALWWARNEQFDLYILNNEFPDGTGLELCRKIKEFDAETPIVFYAEDAAETGKRLAGLSAGARAYLVKPDVEELAVIVVRLLSERGKAAA
jgi:DNA-binding response OmpR family regulator